MRSFHLKAILITSCAACVGIPSAVAQSVDSPQQNTPATPAPSGEDPTRIEDIIVTGTKTGAQSLEKTPQAITVVTGDQLESQGLRNVKDLAPYIPNVTFTQVTTNAQIYIRGIGSNNVNAGSDPDVTTQVDGVYIARPSGQFTDFLDVEAVEILRGPQGTLYGRNAAGGTININSRRPSETFTARAEASIGNYDLLKLGAHISGPVTDNLFFSVAGTYTHRDGFLENIAPGGKDMNALNRGGMRAQLRWEPASNIDATTRADFSVARENMPSYNTLTVAPATPSLVNGIIGDYSKIAIDADQYARPRSGGISQEVNIGLGGGFTLKSVTAWRFNRFDLRHDTDSTNLRQLVIEVKSQESQFSQEINLLLNTGRLKAVAGLYYFNEHDHQTNSLYRYPGAVSPTPALQFYNDSSPVVDVDAAAVFAEGTFDLTDHIAIVAGGRYTVEKKNFLYTGHRYSLAPATLGQVPAGYPIVYELSDTYRAFTPKAGINLQLTPNLLIYGSATRGFKSGGFNLSSSNPAAAAFAPETIWSYEGGLKTQLFDRRLRLNIAGFIYDYKNLQVQALVGPGVNTIGNAANARVKGLEFEATAKLTSELQISGNFSLLDAKYLSFPKAVLPGGLFGLVPGAVCVGTLCTINAAGNYLAAAPKRSGLIALDYNTSIDRFGFKVHVDLTARSRTYFDASNSPLLSQPGYSLINASVSLTDPSRRYTIELWGRNLTDKKYFAVLSGSGSVPGGLPGDPLTFGLRLRAEI